MDIWDSREEWRSSYDDSRSVIIQKMYAVCKIHCLFKKKISVDSCFYRWQEILMKNWLECFRGLSKEMLLSNTNQASLLGSVEGKKGSVLEDLFLSIQQIFETLQEKFENLNEDKEKWLVSQKSLQFYRQIDQSGFTNDISDRINFWKKSLFPEIEFQDFWDHIKYLQPSLKLQILETELFNEKNNLKAIENNWKNKTVVLKREEKQHKKKASEIAAYQNYLEQECSEIQKCWKDIKIIADSLETNPKAQAVTAFLNNRTQSFEDLNKFVIENSLPEISSSQVEVSDDDDRGDGIFIDFSGKKVCIDFGARLKKSALSTVMKYLTIKKTVFTANSFSRWKINTVTPWPTLSKNFSASPSMLPRLKNKSNTNKGLVVMNNRRLVEFEQSSAFFLQQKIYRNILGKMCRKIFFNWKTLLKSKQKAYFLAWRVRSIKHNQKTVQKTLNFSSLKVIFLMSVLLGRSISEGKKLTAFQAWKLNLEGFRIRGRNKELVRIEQKVKENVLKDRSLRLEQKLEFEKLKTKLKILESQIIVLKLDEAGK